jgi:hypothetical protein
MRLAILDEPARHPVAVTVAIVATAARHTTSVAAASLTDRRAPDRSPRWRRIDPGWSRACIRIAILPEAFRATRVETRHRKSLGPQRKKPCLRPRTEV